MQANGERRLNGLGDRNVAALMELVVPLREIQTAFVAQYSVCVCMLWFVFGRGQGISRVTSVPILSAIYQKFNYNCFHSLSLRTVQVH